MKKNFAIISMLALSMTLSGCETKAQQGSMLGAGAGALLGAGVGGKNNRVAGAAIGAVIGSLIGGQVGHYMDEQDKMKAQATSQRALEYSRSGTTSSWHNPDSGHSGTVTPYKAYQKNGDYCREFTQTVNVGGKTERAYGTACRRPDGQWEIVS